MQEKKGASDNQEKDVTGLAWLADAPLFIDGPQVSAFYEAVLLPEATQDTYSTSLKNISLGKFALKGTLGAEASLGDLLGKLFPTFGVKVSGEAGKEWQKGDENTVMSTYRPITSPHRQVLHLAVHYAADLAERLLVVSDPDSPEWRSAAFATALPRGLVFIDFPPGTMFIPVAAELSGGKVMLYYDRTDEGAPEYPEGRSPLAPDVEVLRKKRKEYWQWHRENFSALAATTQIEKAVAKEVKKHSAGAGRIRWIDYRVPVGDDTVHLHLCGRELYDTGVFAYNLIKRGETHGLRMVGTMKSGPDMNVLAIFDR